MNQKQENNQDSLLTDFLNQDDFQKLFQEEEEKTTEVIETEEIKEDDKEPIVEKSEEVEEEKLDDTSSEDEKEDTEEPLNFSFKSLSNILSEEGLIEFEDSDELEDTPEVLYNSIKNTIEKSIKSYKESIPEEAQKIIKFLEDGGDINEYTSTLEKKITYSEDDLESEEVQSKVVKEYLESIGYTKEEIDDTIEAYTDGLILEKQSKIALKKLAAKDANRRQELLEAQERSAEQAREEYNNYINNLYSTIDSSENLAGLPITVKDKNAFKDYLTVVGKDGLTQYQRELNEDPIKNQLELAYLKYQKFDFTKAMKKGEANAVNKWKSILKDNETTVKGGRSAEIAQQKHSKDLEGFRSNFLFNK